MISQMSVKLYSGYELNPVSFFKMNKKFNLSIEAKSIIYFKLKKNVFKNIIYCNSIIYVNEVGNTKILFFVVLMTIQTFFSYEIHP
jgi:hypothetical protein